MFSPEVNIIIVVVAMLITIYSYMWQKKKKAKEREKSAYYGLPIKKDATSADLIGYHEKENDILLRIAEADREINAKLDSKISVLNVLIEKADIKINELKSLQVTSQPVNQANSQKELPKQELLNTKVQKLKEAGLTPAEIANQLKMMVGEVNLILSILKKTKNE